MEMINLTLPDSMKEFVDNQVRIRGYSDREQYVQALIQDAYQASLEAQVAQGLDAIERGEATEMKGADWDRLRSEYKRKQAGGC